MGWLEEIARSLGSLVCVLPHFTENSTKYNNNKKNLLTTNVYIFIIKKKCIRFCFNKKIFFMWLVYLSNFSAVGRPVGQLIAVDILPFAEVEGAIILSNADFKSPKTQQMIRERLQGKKVGSKMERIVLGFLVKLQTPWGLLKTLFRRIHLKADEIILLQARAQTSRDTLKMLLKWLPRQLALTLSRFWWRIARLILLRRIKWSIFLAKGESWRKFDLKPN